MNRDTKLEMKGLIGGILFTLTVLSCIKLVSTDNDLFLLIEFIFAIGFMYVLTFQIKKNKPSKGA